MSSFHRLGALTRLRKFVGQRKRKLTTVLLIASAGCDRVLGLDAFSVDEPAVSARAGECASHSQCAGEFVAVAGAYARSYCQRGHCVSLRSAECDTITGPVEAEGGILIGSLFSTSGAQSSANLARQRSATLAVEEINASGGVSVGEDGKDARPLVLVSCDESNDLLGAAHHLIDDLGVPAIIGPNTSQDTLDLTTRLSIASGTLVISPTAVASSITDLLDDDLSWLMVPTDAQRAPLTVTRLNSLAAQLAGERGKSNLSLGMLMRDDALGRSASVALQSLRWNGEPLSSGSNIGQAVRIDSYDPHRASFADLVEAYVSFAPDIIVMVGTGETVSALMAPIERAWRAPQRPHYVLTDSSKVPELIELVRSHPELRARISGSGLRPTAACASVYADFREAYAARFDDAPAATISGVGSTYDATYAVGYALAAQQDAAPSGKQLARGLRILSSGEELLPLGRRGFRTGTDPSGPALPLGELGTLTPLRWDDRGAVVDATVEIWCMGTADDGAPAYASSGLRYEIATGQTQGDYRECGAIRGEAPLDTGPPPIGRASRPEQAQSPIPELPDSNDAGTPPDTNPGAAAPSVARALACGPTACGARPEEYCCIAPARLTLGVLQRQEFSCETEPRSCAFSLFCTSDADCGTEQVCCSAAGQATCIPATQACPGAHFACTSARECPAGNQCCSHLTADNLAYESTRCEAQCDAAASAHSAPLCESAADCRPGIACRPSNYLPNLKVCNQ